MTDDLERARPADRDQAIAVVESAYAAGRTIAVPVDDRSRRQMSYAWDGGWSEFGGSGTSTFDRFSPTT